jgi:predicted RecA/RadA family phage recombinase
MGNEKKQNEKKHFKSKYLLRALKGDWWITGNHVMVDEHFIEVRKRNWHLISVDSLQLHWQNVQSILIDKHLFGATVRISSGNAYHRIFGLPKKTANAIRNLATSYLSENSQKGVTEALADAIAKAVNSSNANKGEISSADELLKFKKLHEQGVISDKEFKAAKERLLR